MRIFFQGKSDFRLPNISIRVTQFNYIRIWKILLKDSAIESLLFIGKISHVLLPAELGTNAWLE